MIAEQLRALAVSIDLLNPDPANARKHGEKNIQAIKSSLAQFGQRKPVVVQRQGMIVRAGNGTLQAAKALGWKELAAVVVDDDSSTAVQYAIADNRTAELAEWDTETLATLLDGMDDATRDALAFTGEDMDKILADLEADGFLGIEGGGDLPDLDDGDKTPFQQITFTLHDTQVDVVKAACKRAKQHGGGDSKVNKNSNGNALAMIAEAYLGRS